MRRYGFSVRMGLVAVMALAACKDSSGPDAESLDGSWVGLALLPNGYTTTMTLQESGSSTTGTLKIAGVFPSAGAPMVGQVDWEDRTLVWTAARTCEVWGGVMTISDDGESMSGAVLIDRTGCVPAQSSGSGTMSLTRQ